MKSRGDSWLWGTEEGRNGVGASLSVAGGEGCWATSAASVWTGERFDTFERKLGIGRAEGAGDAWKVAPAKAALLLVLVDMDD